MLKRTVLQEADTLLPKAPSSTLVIHLDDPSTDFLKVIYEGKGFDVISAWIVPEKLKAEIEAHDRIFMLGHGGPGGLFGPGYTVGAEFGPILRQKKGLYIWCHAIEYAHLHKLSGLVSGMFISEVHEASWAGIQATQEEVDASNAAFAAAVRKYLDTGASPHTVRDCYNSTVCKVTQYNNDRLYVVEDGVIVDSLGNAQPDDVSAKPGSPRFRDLNRQFFGGNYRPQGAYGDLNAPPEEFTRRYGWGEEEAEPELGEQEWAKITGYIQQYAQDKNKAFGAVRRYLTYIGFTYPEASEYAWEIFKNLKQ